MTYITAFVFFSDPAKEFPAQCFRTDLAPGDDVIVRKESGELVIAKVNSLRYLNWDCRLRIECKRDEVSLDAHECIVLPKGCPLNYGISTPVAFAMKLEAAGWIRMKKTKRMYTYVLRNINATSTAYIFVRKNGIDIQIFQGIEDKPIEQGLLLGHSFSDGRVVRHSLSHTKFNLYEGILRFSKSFLDNEENLDRYFVCQGSSDRRTDELKENTRLRNMHRNEMLDIYDACSGEDGEPAYLGDGMWITSDGRTHDWGR